MLAGCSKRDQITSYRVPKPHVLRETNSVEPASPGDESDRRAAPAASEPARLLAATVIRGERAWFFKLSGPRDKIDPHAEAFAQFVASIRFEGEDDAQPVWKLPDGWSQAPAAGSMRFATLSIGSSGAELSVIPLPKTIDDDRQYLLQNVNRWRRQVSLPPLAEGELDAAMREVAIGDDQAFLVDFVGTQSGAPRPPFAMGRPPGGSRQQPERTAASEPSISFSAPVPQGWQEAGPVPFSKATYEVTSAEGSAQVTVSALPAGIPLADDVNRWRGQLGLPPASAQQVEDSVEPITMDGREGRYVELVGPDTGQGRSAIAAAIVEVDDRAWYFKLRGDAPVVARQRPQFRALIASSKFSNGDANGR